MEITLAFLVLLLVVLIGFFWQLDRFTLADWGGPWRNRIAGLNTLLCRRLHRLRAEPLKLPVEGPAVVAANHISGLDPLLLIAASPRPLRFLIAEEEYRRFGFTWLYRLAGCIPVDRSGRPERAYREALRRLHQGEVVALFPQGRIHKRNEPSPKLKGGVVRLAQLAACPVLPVRISGVGGEGLVIGAVWRPSHARLELQSALACPVDAERRSCLEQLSESLGIHHNHDKEQQADVDTE